jgi:hypothetical protein
LRHEVWPLKPGIFKFHLPFFLHRILWLRFAFRPFNIKLLCFGITIIFDEHIVDQNNKILMIFFKEFCKMFLVLVLHHKNLKFEQLSKDDISGRINIVLELVGQCQPGLVENGEHLQLLIVKVGHRYK